MEQKLARAAELVREGWTQAAAAREVGISQGALSMHLNLECGEPLERVVREMRALLDRAYADAPESGRIKTSFPCKVVFLDDLHVPFTDPDVIHAVIQRERGADMLLTHELMNYDAFSFWDQEYLSDPTGEEILAVALLRELRNHFGRIICGTSNHVERVRRALSSGLRPEQRQYLKERLVTVFDALREVGVEHRRTPVLQIGDAVFGHYDRTLSTPGQTVQRFRRHADAWWDEYGITRGISAAFTGHTHRVAVSPFDGAPGYGYEVGCSSFAQPYVFNMRRGGRLAEFRAAVGYGVAVFDSRGRVDLVESRAVHLGWARTPRGLKHP